MIYQPGFDSPWWNILADKFPSRPCGSEWRLCLARQSLECWVCGPINFKLILHESQVSEMQDFGHLNYVTFWKKGSLFLNLDHKY